MILIPANLNHFDFFYKMKCDEFNMYWTGHETKPDRENLKLFFEKSIMESSQSQKRKIYILLNVDQNLVGYIYIIPDGEEFDLPIAIDKQYGGKGYAKKAIKLGLSLGKELGFKKMVGSIREDNIASLKAYTSCGVKVAEDYRVVKVPNEDRKVKMFTVYIDLTDISN